MSLNPIITILLTVIQFKATGGFWHELFPDDLNFTVSHFDHVRKYLAKMGGIDSYKLYLVTLRNELLP